MKNFRFSVMLLSVLALAACADGNKKTSSGEVTSETAETTNKSEGITGKWKVDQWHIEGAFEEGDFMAEGINMGSITITFKDDGTFVSDGDQFTAKSTVNVEGMKFSNEFTNKNPFNTGTWEKVGAVLKVKNDGEPEVYEYHIDNLTSKRMEMSLDDYKLEEGDMDGDFKAKMGFVR